MDCNQLDVPGLVALCDMGETETYFEIPGKLYPGSNDLPSAHRWQGIMKGNTIKKSASFVCLVMGASNARDEGNVFLEKVEQREDLNPAMRWLSFAGQGRSSQKHADPNDNLWTNLPIYLADHDADANQVRVVWYKFMPMESSPEREGLTFPERLTLGIAELHAIIQNIKANLPKVQQIFISGRTFGGYALTDQSPEPQAYETAFPVKLTVQDQIDGLIGYGPCWIGWGPYLWAQGQTPRSDGLFYTSCDFNPDDLMHPCVEPMCTPGPDGGACGKVSDLLIEFFDTEGVQGGVCPWWYCPIYP